MTEALVQGTPFRVDRQGDQLRINDQVVQPDVKALHPQLWHVLHQHHSYHVFVQKIDLEAKSLTLSVNGKRTEVKIHSRMEKLLADLGMSHATEKKLDLLKAPMPGLIQKVQVQPGDVVTKGQPLLILEAMKMENVIKAPGDGKVKEVVAKEGHSVEKNAVLIRFA